MRLMMGIVACFMLLFSAPVSHAEKIVMATGEWGPFTSASMENYGEFIERVNIVLHEMGIESSYRFNPWRRCYDSVLKGLVWAPFPYSFTEGRAKEVWFARGVKSLFDSFWLFWKQSAAK